MFVEGASVKYKIKAMIIVVIGFVTMYCTGMFGTDIINVIQNPIMEKLGCSATSAVMGWSIAGYTVLVATYFFSTIVMKWGPRKFATLCLMIMVAGAACVGVGYNLNSVFVIAIGGILLRNFAIALQTCTFQVVAGWFNKTRGFIFGILGASFALDNSTSSTGLTLLYNKLGFTGMITAGAALMFVIGIATYLFVRNTPEEYGLTMDGVENKKIKQEESEAEEFKSKWTLGKLLSKKETWCIALTIGVLTMTLTCVVTQFFNSLMSMGVEAGNCMKYMVIFGMLGIVMSPIYGKMVDKIGAPKTGMVAAVLYILSVAGFCLKIPALGAMGLTVFVGAPILQPALTIHVFGAREYQSANRYISVLVNLIGACAIPFMTILYDLTGGYEMAYRILLVMNVVAFLFMMICKKTYVEEEKDCI